MRKYKQAGVYPNWVGHRDTHELSGEQLMPEQTHHTRRGSDLLGMPVYSITEGKKLGEITTLLVRREDSTVAAVRVGNAIAQGVALSYGLLRLVGIDIILVDSEAVMGQSLPIETVSALDDAVTGRAVLTVKGDQVGTISGFLVETQTGHITAYRVLPEAGIMTRIARLVQHDTLEVPIAQVQALGANALIVLDNLTVQADAGAVA